MPKPHYWWDDPDLREQVRVLVCEQYDRRAGYRLVQQHGYTGTLTTFYGRLGILDWVLPQGEAVRRKHAAGRGEPVSTSTPEPAPPAKDFSSDKKVGSFSWRRANQVMREMQDLKTEASGSQDYGNIRFLEHVTGPICLTSLCDLHMGSWATDHETIERVTDEILSTPNLYVGLLGDEEQMSIKMRSVLEVADNLLPPSMQHAYFESWMNEVQHKILFSTWENHAAMREESQAGFSYSSEIKKRRVIYHNGIGHTNITVGNETYRFAVSHFFRGRSMYNPVHGQMRYGRHEGQDREIVMAGDSHTPGVLEYWEGGKKRVGINGGTAQVNSGYGKRFFSLTTASVWPCVVLYPNTHIFTPFWSVQEWLAATKGVAA